MLAWPWGVDKPHSVRSHLIVYGAAVAAPLALLLGAMHYRGVLLERAQLEARMLQMASNLADDVDREIERRLAMLQTLATSPSLAEADWPRFYAQAEAATRAYGYIVLVDSDSRQILNTFVPFGSEPSRDGNPESVREVVETKQPIVSNVFISLVTKKPVFNIRMPILREGKVEYILSLGLLTDTLLPILRAQRLDEEWSINLRDRKDVVVARFPGHDKYVGKQLPDALVRERLMYRVVDTKNQEGDRVLLASALSIKSGWRISVNVPVELVEAPLRASLWVWGGASALAVVLAGVLALLFAQKLEVPLTMAAKSAGALGRGEPVPTFISGLQEANIVVDAMAGASRDLAERDRRQRLLMAELSHRVKNVLAVVQAIVSRTLSSGRSDAQQLIEQRLHALSRAHDLLTRTDWQGARLADIIRAEVTAHIGQVSLEGPDLTIKGETVQTLALILHELATNAVKHGALSIAKGRVDVSWTVKGSGSDGRFFFRWQERDGPAVRPPDRTGFGSTLLVSAIPGDGSSSPRLSFEPDGFVYEFEAPLNSIIPED